MTPKTKKLIYKISIGGMIVSAVGFITACRYTYMADTETMKIIHSRCQHIASPQGLVGP